MTEFVLKEVEVSKLNLQPGDVLTVKLRGEDFDSIEIIDSLRDTMKNIFPNNKVIVFRVSDENTMELGVVSQSAEQGESDEYK